MDKLLYTFFDKNLISIKSGHRIYLNSKNNTYTKKDEGQSCYNNKNSKNIQFDSG